MLPGTPLVPGKPWVPGAPGAPWLPGALGRPANPLGNEPVEPAFGAFPGNLPAPAPLVPGNVPVFPGPNDPGVAPPGPKALGFD